MEKNSRRGTISLVVFLIWASITAFLSRLWQPLQGRQSLDASVSGEVQISFLIAILFLLAAIGIFRWRDIGLAPPRSARPLLLLWFPGLYIVLFMGLAALTGLPPAKTILIVLANTLMAGISEELACRGVLYCGLRSTLSIWPAILISTALFGLVHLLNGFSTGDFGAASVQAVTAFMTGMAFLAIRIRTGSLLPGMALHGLWDFVLVTSIAGAAVRAVPAAPSSHGAWFVFLPMLLILPNFLYGMFLLRHAARDEAAMRNTVQSVNPAGYDDGQNDHAKQ